MGDLINERNNIMPLKSIGLLVLLIISSITFANSPCDPPCPKPSLPPINACPGCCAQMGGIQYCDSSAGRFVCNNGDYSSCYCTDKAVMDLQKIEGCCLWQGGVMASDETGLVVCNNGGISETCSLQNVTQLLGGW